jgi:hypothetical protein
MSHMDIEWWVKTRLRAGSSEHVLIRATTRGKRFKCFVCVGEEQLREWAYSVLFRPVRIVLLLSLLFQILG